MLGLWFGTACLIGFLVVAFKGRGSCGGRWGYHRHFASHHGPASCRASGGRWYGAFERLDTSPGQEKAIRAAMDEMSDRFGALRPALRHFRAEIAEALRQEAFDPAVVERAVAAQSSDLQEARQAIATALAKVHDALDPDQRRRVARWLEAGHGPIPC